MERSCGVCEPVRRRENCADEAQPVCGRGRERSRPGFSRRRDSAGAAGKRGTAFFAGPSDSGPYGRGGAERAGGDGVEERSGPAARDMAGGGAGGGGGRGRAGGGRGPAGAGARRARGRVGEAFGRWRWEAAPRLAPNTADRAAILSLLDRLRAALETADTATVNEIF